MRTPGRLLALPVLVLVACADAGSAPRDLRVQTYSRLVDFDTVWVTWAPPTTGDFASYQLEWRAEGSGTGVVRAFAPGATSGFVDLGPTFPDGTQVEFTLRALPDPKGTRGVTATIQRGVRPPSIACAGGSGPCTAGPEGFALAVANRSGSATSLTLVRSKVLPDGQGPVAGPTFTLATTATAFNDPLDGDWSEEATYQYELTARSGDLASLAVSVTTAPLPLLSPVAPTVTAATGGLEVAFEARSGRAQCYRVRRLDPFARTDTLVAPCLAPPPPGSVGTYLDTGASADRIQIYEVSAQGAVTASMPARAIWLPPPPAGLSRTVLAIPPATSALRTMGGAFLTAAGQVLYGPGPAGPVALAIPAAHGAVPLAESADGSLYALATEWQASEVGVGLILARFDGAIWSTEELARGSIRDAIDLRAGLDGVLRAAWTDQDLHVAAGAGGAMREWTFRGEVASTSALRVAVAGDADGTTHVVSRGADDRLAHRFSAPGGWGVEPVPEVSAYQQLALLAAPGRLRLIGVDWGWVTVVERDAAGWGTPYALAPAPEFLDPVAVGSSRDGATAAVASSAALWVFGAGGLRTLTRPPTGCRVVAAGARDDGRAWFVEALPSLTTTSGEVYALLYEEP